MAIIFTLYVQWVDNYWKNFKQYTMRGGFDHAYFLNCKKMGLRKIDRGKDKIPW